MRAKQVVYLTSHVDNTHVPSLVMAGGCLALMRLWPKPWGKVVPPPMVAIGAGTLGLLAAQAAVTAAAGDGSDASAQAMMSALMGIETIGSHFGADAIPRSLPMPTMPSGLT